MSESVPLLLPEYESSGDGLASAPDLGM